MTCLPAAGKVVQTDFDAVNASHPETLTIPIPPRPGGVEIATIVSSLIKTLVRNSSAVRFFYHTGDAPLLGYRQ